MLYVLKWIYKTEYDQLKYKWETKLHSIKNSVRQNRASIRRVNISYICKFVPYQLSNSYFQQYILAAAEMIQVHWNFHIMHTSLMAKNKLVSSGVSLTSWGGVSLALFDHPSSDGIAIKIPYRVDVLLHRPALHPIFFYWVG